MTYQNAKNQFSCDPVLLSDFFLCVENYCLVLVYKKTQLCKAGNQEKRLDKVPVAVDVVSWREELPVLHEKMFSFRASAD